MTESGEVSLGVDLTRFADSYKLTTREREIVGLLVRGCDSVPRMAETLSLSRNTVHNHFKNIFRRTRCNSKTGLLAKFIAGVASRRARSVVATPRVLLLDLDQEHESSLVARLTRLGMQVYAERNAALLLDRIRDLKIHVLVADGARHEPGAEGPVAMVAEIYNDHPAIFYADAGPTAPGHPDDSQLVSTRQYRLPDELDRMAVAIYRHCNKAGFHAARPRRLNSSLSVRLSGKRLATVSNISLGGAFIEFPSGDDSPALPLAGSMLELALALPNDGELALEAEVVWTRPSAVPGIGVRFHNLDAGETDRLRMVLRSERLRMAV